MLVPSAQTFDIQGDDTYIYYSDQTGELNRVSKKGGTPENLGLFPGTVELIRLDASNLYVMTSDEASELDTLWSLPKNGGTPAQLAGGISTPFDLALDDQYVYWVTIGTPTADDFVADGKVERIRKDGSGRQLLASNLNTPTAVAVDATNVYYSEAGLSSETQAAGVRSMPKGGGPIRALSSSPFVFTIALRDSQVLFPVIDFTGTTIEAVSKSGGSATPIFSGLDFVPALRVVGDTIYYYNSGDTSDTIERVPLAGGSRTVVVTGPFATVAFVVDDCAIFYEDDAGNLNRAPRPD